MAKIVPTAEMTTLRETYSSGSAAKAILDDFARRTNNQRITKVDQIQHRLRYVNVQRSEVIALFRKLDELEHGTFIEGRKGHPSRFVWASSPIDVGRAAQGNEVPITLVADGTAGESGEEMRSYVFPLRSTTDATFEVPADLTQTEAERLSAFLKTLAVPE